MKKLLLSFVMLVSSFAVAQTTTIYQGQIKDLTNTVVTSGQVTFTLKPSLSTTISGSSTFTPLTVTCSITGAGAVKANDGTSDCTVVNNTSLTPSGTSYAICIQPYFVTPGSCLNDYALGVTKDISTIVPTPTTSPAFTFVDLFSAQTISGNKTFTGSVSLNGSLSFGALSASSVGVSALGTATSGANFNSGNFTATGSYWNGSAATADVWTWKDVMGAGTNPVGSLTLSHSGTSGTASINFGGTLLCTLNGAPVAGSSCYPTLATCLTAAATAKSVCEVPANYAETVAADIVMTNDVGFHFNGVAAITLGTHQFKCTSGTCNDFFIDGNVPFGSAGSPSAGVVFTYTGTTTPFSFGDASADTFSISLKNFALNVSGGGASVSAIKLNRVAPFKIDAIRLIGTTGQIGVELDGTGNYTGNGDIFIHANGFKSCMKMTKNGNSNRIFASCANTAASGKAIDITSGNGNIFQLDAENASTGVAFGDSTDVFGNRGKIYGQGNTTDATFGTASIANTIDNVGANCSGIVPTVSDSGTSNSFWNPCKFKVDVSGNVVSSGTVKSTQTGAGAGGSGASFVATAATFPTVGWVASGGGADQKNWDMLGSSSQMIFRAVSDNNGTAGNGMIFNRGSGVSIVSVDFDPPLDFLEHTAPAAAASLERCYGDSTSHALFCAYNNGTFFRIAQEITATSAAFATATTAGTCVQNTTAVTGAATTMAVLVSPVSTPGVGAQWSAFVSSAGNVTINECAVAVSAGGTIAFNIRVLP